MVKESTALAPKQPAADLLMQRRAVHEKTAPMLRALLEQ